MNEQQAAIRALQEALYQLGQEPLVLPNGVYGPETTAAVRRFQQSHGLPPSGQVDERTWNQIFAAYRQQMAARARPAAIAPFPLGQFEMDSGTACPAIGLLQVMLSALSRRFSNIRCIPITQELDAATLQQVGVIQSVCGAAPTACLTCQAWDQVTRLYNLVCMQPAAAAPVHP